MAKKKTKMIKKKQLEERITMEALEEMSDSDEEAVVPASQWSTKAQKLKQEIEGGTFDKLLGVLKKAKAEGGEEEFEEDTLDSSSSDVEEEEEGAEENQREEVSEVEEGDDNEQQQQEESVGESETEEVEREGADKIKEIFEKKHDENSGEEDSEEEEDDEKSEKALRMIKNNQMNYKALSVVTGDLVASHSHLPWAETFEVVPETPLPFGEKPDPESGTSPLDIHDDLKREVAFYNCALEAVHKARENCNKAQIPFSRPEDFFAEMIKTDDHMAKVKDRLIFETKKMDAVAQRKSNREQKLRAKESHANKLAEKAKRKRDHFQEVEEWANAAAKNRGGALQDDADDRFLNRGPNKKREAANRKYGFGGKKGHFKQNDRSSMNDVSGFNPRGNFAGGMKKSAKNGAGAARQGKRARDAKNARR